MQVICNAICGLSPRANSLTGTLAGNSGITISSKRFALFEIIVGFTSVPTGYTHIAYPLSQQSQTDSFVGIFHVCFVQIVFLFSLKTA